MEFLGLLLVAVVIIGIISIDHRLKKLVTIEQASLDQQRENAKALQFLVERKAEARSQRSEA